MKNILLPTDLSVQSLWPIHNIVKDAGSEKVCIHVVHTINPPTSITELLTLKEPYGDIPSNFTEAIQLLRNKYKDSIEKIQFQFLYCNTRRYLGNFIEARKIDAVYMLNNYDYERPLRQSEKCNVNFNKCKVPVHKLPLHAEALSEYQILSALLNYNEQNVRVAATLSVNNVVSYS